MLLLLLAAFPILSPPQCESLWLRGGSQLVRRKVSSYRDFTPDDPKLCADYRRLFQQLEKVPLKAAIQPVTEFANEP